MAAKLSYIDPNEEDLVGNLNLLIRRKRVDKLAWLFLKVRLTPMQCRIVKAIVYTEHNRIAITAYTRYGKSYAVAIAVALFLLINPRRVRMAVVAPTRRQTTIIRNYLTDMISRSKILMDMLGTKAKNIGEGLKKEVSKERLVFSDGKELATLTAGGDGNGLMGFGADILIVDEACLIGRHVYTGKLIRMLGDDPENAVLVEISNPWSRDSVFYDHFIDPEYLVFQIDWKTGVREKRTTEKFIMEMKKGETPMLFTVLYEADFPEESEDQLIRLKWVQDAIHRAEKWEEEGKDITGLPSWGLDVAEAGLDFTVLTEMLESIPTPENDQPFHVVKFRHWHKADTMETVSMTRQHIAKDEITAIDANGVGKGVADRLIELEYDIIGYKGAYGLEDGFTKEDAGRFSNWKAAANWWMRDLFEEGRIYLHDAPDELRRDLLRLKYKVNSSGKIQVFVEGNEIEGRKVEKSPDFSDSLSLAVFAAKRRPGILN